MLIYESSLLITTRENAGNVLKQNVIFDFWTRRKHTVIIFAPFDNCRMFLSRIVIYIRFYLSSLLNHFLSHYPAIFFSVPLNTDAYHSPFPFYFTSSSPSLFSRPSTLNPEVTHPRPPAPSPGNEAPNGNLASGRRNTEQFMDSTERESGKDGWRGEEE